MREQGPPRPQAALELHYPKPGWDDVQLSFVLQAARLSPKELSSTHFVVLIVIVCLLFAKFHASTHTATSGFGQFFLVPNLRLERLGESAIGLLAASNDQLNLSSNTGGHLAVS